MRMTHFKNANVDVSQLAVGTWGLDSLRWNGAMSEDEAIAAIRAMIQGGVNLIDTAPVSYTHLARLGAAGSGRLVHGGNASGLHDHGRPDRRLFKSLGQAARHNDQRGSVGHGGRSGR